MGEFSITHLLLVGVIFLIFFGPSRLPQLGQSLGKAIRGFKDGLNEIETQAKDVSDDRDEQAPKAAATRPTEQPAQQSRPATTGSTDPIASVSKDQTKKPDHQS